MKDLLLKKIDCFRLLKIYINPYIPANQYIHLLLIHMLTQATLHSLLDLVQPSNRPEFSGHVKA